MLRAFLILFTALFLLGGCASSASHQEARNAASYGVLIMAHGGEADWNSAIEAMADEIRDDYIVEIAFGMADAGSIQGAVHRLEAQGVRQIGVVRLFISGDSWFERTEQILGISLGAPMRMMDEAAAAHHGGHAMAFWQIDTISSFALSEEGLSEAPEMGRVLVERARQLSTDPQQESILILAHGPADDAENQRWLSNIDARADSVRRALPFRHVEVQTLREDWAEKRVASEQRIRAFVEQAAEHGSPALVIPYRVYGFGPYAEVLDGLPYVANQEGLLPSHEVARWVRRQVELLQRSESRNPAQVQNVNPGYGGGT